MKKITIELADHEIQYLKEVAELWGQNDGGEPYAIEDVAATLASVGAREELGLR